MNKEELIPCDDELNRLKIFLATVAAGRALSPEMQRALDAMHERHQDWIDLLKGGPFPKV